MKKLGETCILEDRNCTECGECDQCEHNPNKICNNCCKCIDQPGSDYAGIKIDDILLNVENKKKTSLVNINRSFRFKPKP